MRNREIMASEIGGREERAVTEIEVKFTQVT